MKKLTTYFAVLLFGLSVQAQNIEPCGYDQYIRDLDKANPGFAKRLDEQYHKSIQQINSQKLGKRESDTIYRIPVVFHIVYNTPQENLDDSLIISQMEILNECFRRKNKDTGNTRDIFKPIAGDVKVEFYLAEVDPNGNPTDGIVRQSTNKTTFYTGGNTLNMDQVKKASSGGSNPWNTDKYLNVWVCDLSVGGIAYLLGYAFPPVNASGWNQNSFVGKERQGVVLHYGIVGAGNPYDNTGVNSTGARTAVHEVGHFLGLRHIWGDGLPQLGCTLDDFIDDTPVTASRNTGCNKRRNTCNEGVGDMPDLIENYMDYSPGTCVNMFTQMQANLMLYNLHNLRSGLAETIIPEPLVFPATRNLLYPVPFDNIVTLELMDVDPSRTYTIEITNLLGQLIHAQEHTLDVEKSKLDLSFLTLGIYYFGVYKNNELLYSRKLVKY
jgi:hypothetical protein